MGVSTAPLFGINISCNDIIRRTTHGKTQFTLALSLVSFDALLTMPRDACFEAANTAAFFKPKREYMLPTWTKAPP